MKIQNKKQNFNILRFVKFFIPAFLLISSLFYIFGTFYVKLFLPQISYIIELINPEYEILEFKLAEIDKTKQIVYKVAIHRNFVNENGDFCNRLDVFGKFQQSNLFIHHIIKK